MADTPNLGLPYLIAAQAQKHITHNEAIRALDALVQLAVIGRDGTVPPDAPANGDRYIVGADSTGAWAGHANAIAAFQDGGWAFFAPRIGWCAWIIDESILAAWDGSAWIAVGGGSDGGDGTFDILGINATADETNRLALSSPASLFNHAGAGHQVKLNKSAADDTASFLFQTNWSGRAEIGTAGDDDFHFKVSPNGSAWHDALVIDKDTGSIDFPEGATIDGAGIALREPGINAQSGTSYTLALADRGQLVTMSNAAANTLSIPANATVPFPLGTIISVVQLSTGTTTITADTGVILNGTSAGSSSIAARYQAAALLKIGTDTWTVSGDLGDAAVTAAARTLLAQTTQALMRTVGLGFSADASSLVVAANYAAMRALLAITQADVAGLTSASSPQFSALNIGHASDTTLARTAAGVLNIEGKDLALQEPGLNAQTGTSYTLALADKGRIIIMSNASANTLTIPANSAVSFPVGTIIDITQIGAGTTSISAATGVTLNGVSAGTGAIAARWQGVALLKTATDTWVASGAIGDVA